MYVYVINKDGKPLMPCSCAKAKHLLKAGKAKVVKRLPFTIKLLWECESKTQEVVGGMDAGSRIVGCAAIANGRVLYQSEVVLRADISRRMTRRRTYRTIRRGRKTRYRQCRISNRASSRRIDRLSPTISSKVQSHVREKNFVESILPVVRWIVETASFDIAKISNPSIEGEDYQNGPQRGFYNVKAYVLSRDGYSCAQCKKSSIRLEVHHIISRSQGGSNAPLNLVTLCQSCHKLVHASDFAVSPKRVHTKNQSHISVISSQLLKYFGFFIQAFGYDTKYKRELLLDLPKTHYYDGVAICWDGLSKLSLLDTVFIKRHVSKGDYRQTMGVRSEKKIPTRKLFGLRKFDLIKTARGTGFVKGKTSTGYFTLSDIYGKTFTICANVKKHCTRISARSTTLVSCQLTA